MWKFLRLAEMFAQSPCNEMEAMSNKYAQHIKRNGSKM